VSQDEALPMTWEGVVQSVDRFVALWGRSHLDPPPEIRLTRGQLGRVRQEIPTLDFDLCPGALMFGIPVKMVDDVEDSTPFQRWHEQFLTAVRKVDCRGTD